MPDRKEDYVLVPSAEAAALIEAARIEALIAASEPAMWASYAPLLPASYRSAYVRRAHRAGFEAGLAFAGLALKVPNHTNRTQEES